MAAPTPCSGANSSAMQEQVGIEKLPSLDAMQILARTSGVHLGLDGKPKQEKRQRGSFETLVLPRANNE